MGTSNIVVGRVFNTKKSGDCVVIEYIGKYDITVRFLDTGSIINTNASLLRNGATMDKFKPVAFGVGYVGIGKYNSRESKGGAKSKAYSSWSRMLRRCYDPTGLDWEGYGAKGVTVCEEWHNFQNFAKWFNSQKSHDVVGIHLDKDLTILGNNTYRPEACELIPACVNCLHIYKENNKERELPEGVSWDKNCGKYRADKYTQGRVISACFTDIEVAHLSYIDCKYKHIKGIAEREYRKGTISEVIYNNLINFRIEGYANETVSDEF